MSLQPNNVRFPIANVLEGLSKEGGHVCMQIRQESHSVDESRVKIECTTLLYSINVEEVTELEKVELQITPMMN